MPKFCARCDEPFKSRRASHRYCSKRCSNLAEPRGNVVKRLDGTHYERNAERIKRERRERYANDPEYRAKVLARVKARKALPDKQPCERCGVPRADRHHDDYSKPLEIRWLCRSCHVAEHIEQYGSWGEGLRTPTR